MLPHLAAAFPICLDAAWPLVDLEYTAVDHDSRDRWGQPRRLLADFEPRRGGLGKPTAEYRSAERADVELAEPRVLSPVRRVLSAGEGRQGRNPHGAAHWARLSTPRWSVLQMLVALASREGIRVGLLTEVGRMTENPDTAIVMCDNVKGLGLTLDPSHYIYGPRGGVELEHVMKHVYHVRLRDTTQDQLQVRVGQGEVEYGRLVNQLNKVATTERCASTSSPPPKSTSSPKCARCGCCWRVCCSRLRHCHADPLPPITRRRFLAKRRRRGGRVVAAMAWGRRAAGRSQLLRADGRHASYAASRRRVPRREAGRRH